MTLLNSSNKNSVLKMYRREFLILAASALMAIGMVAGCTGLLVYRLNAAVSEVAEITVPDFLSTGKLIQRLLENWSKVLLIHQSSQPAERLKLIEEVNANSTEPQIREFQETQTSPAQQIHFNNLMIARAQFIELRGQYFNKVTKGELEVADELLNAQLMPAFKAYRQSADALYASTMKIGKIRAAHVVQASNTVVAGAGILSALAFVAGLLVGFSTLFRGLKWAHFLANRTSPTSDS